MIVVSESVAIWTPFTMVTQMDRTLIDTGYITNERKKITILLRNIVKVFTRDLSTVGGLSGLGGLGFSSFFQDSKSLSQQ